MKCPNCGAQTEKRLDDGRYKCTCCLSIFSADEQQTNNSTLAKNVFDIMMKKSFSNQSTSISSTEMSAEEVYEKSISGVAEILCVDLNSAGSGFIVSDKGYVVSNAHVILNDNGGFAKEIYCRINGEVIPARVVEYFPDKKPDLSLLQLAAMPRGASAVTLGNSDNVKIGSTVYAIGNSKGDGLCITKGIVSDKNRQAFGANCIMADVATNPGNSGGPLFDVNGKVVAVCVGQRVDAEGMRYFIPINYAKDAYKKYI